MRYYLFLPGVLLFLFLAGCNESNNQDKQDRNRTAQDGVRFRQYRVQGKLLYRQYCSNCHRENGAGLGTLMPPLEQSDFMLEDIDRTICIIKYGLSGKINVNGTEYDHVMPANLSLTPIEIAEIATYIYNSWGNNKGMIGIKTVEKALSTCHVREK